MESYQVRHSAKRVTLLRNMMERGGLAVAILLRVAQALLTALAASVIVWAILPLAPGDVAERVLLGRGMQDITSEEIEATREALGLNEPLVVDRKSTRLNSSHPSRSRMPSSA